MQWQNSIFLNRHDFFDKNVKIIHSATKMMTQFECECFIITVSFGR